MSTIKSSSEDLTLNADGSNEVKFQINAVEKASINSSGLFTSTTIDATALTGNLPAISGASLTGLPAGGDLRNYFIDGGHTQWPEGTGATTFASDYQAGGHPLFIHYNITGTGTLTTERSTDVPTIAASGYQSQYSQLIKCTGTDASVGTSSQASMRYHMTGTDFAHLHQQEITISFWAKTSAQNSGHKYFWTLINSGNNRTYSHSFSPTSTWTKFSHTLTLDTSGTWLFTEADVGMKFQINLAIGPEYDDATEDTWTGTFELHDGTISNFTDHTSNEFYFTQIQIVKGSSSPDFTSPPIATVRDQMDYYVQRYEYDTLSTEAIGPMGSIGSGTLAYYFFFYRNKLRKLPVITSSAASSFTAGDGGALKVGSAISFGYTGTNATYCLHTHSDTNWTTVGRSAYLYRSSTDTCWIMLDARH